jgi:hypothetical protein
MELEHVFDNLHKYHVSIFLDFYARVGKAGTFNSAIRNETLHDTSNDNEVTVVNFVTYKNLSKVVCSHILTVINLLGI